MVACQKEEDKIIIRIENEDYIKDRTFNKPVFIDASASHTGGEVYFYNCTFENIEGDAIYSDQTALSIDNCVFRNVNGNAVYFFPSNRYGV